MTATSASDGRDEVLGVTGGRLPSILSEGKRERAGPSLADLTGEALVLGRLCESNELRSRRCIGAGLGSER